MGEIGKSSVMERENKKKTIKREREKEKKKENSV